METRPLGKTGHSSTVAIFGAAALMAVDQPTADRAVETVMKAGVNHVDVAPSYGDAEIRLAPWTEELVSNGVLIGCKTGQRSSDGARRELERSLETLHMDKFPLYQLHAVGDLKALDEAMDALEGLIQAQSEGLIEHIGITGHGHRVAETILEALRRYEFATVMFPVNAKLWSIPEYRARAEEVLELAEEKQVGVLAIKALARQPRSDDQEYDTWYEPFDTNHEIENSVRFTLSQKITAFCTPGDTRLLGSALDAAETFEPMNGQEQAELIAETSKLVSIFS